jgi:hypothetical protein
MTCVAAGILAAGLLLGAAQEVPAGTGDLLRNLDIMSVLLSRQVEESKERIGATDRAALFLLSRYLQAGEDGAGSVSSEYVPGVGALFSMSVAVRVEAVAEPPDAANGGEHRDLWEEARQHLGNPEVFARSGSGLFGRAAVGSEEAAPVTYRFAEEALTSLEDVLLGAVAEYGHRLDLPAGEKVMVAVRLRTGAALGVMGSTSEGSGTSGESAPPWGARHETPLDAAASFATPYVDLHDGLYGVAGAMGLRVEGPRRLVIQVPAADTVSFHERSLTLEKLVRNARVDRL